MAGWTKQRFSHHKVTWWAGQNKDFLITKWHGGLDKTKIVSSLQVTCDRWFSPGTPISSTNKTDCHNITEILLTVALNTFNISVIFVVFENSTWLLSGQLYLKYCIHRNHACWSTCSYIGWMFHTWPSTKVLVDYIQILITGPFENKFWNVFSKYKNNRSNNKSDRRQVNIWDTWKILKYLNLNVV
jgi:hypothetical protein